MTPENLNAEMALTEDFAPAASAFRWRQRPVPVNLRRLGDGRRGREGIQAAGGRDTLR